MSAVILGSTVREFKVERRRRGTDGWNRNRLETGRYGARVEWKLDPPAGVGECVE